ncbi:MAG: hypothetical protein JXI43_13070 [Tissierellales bacterium]|nr:hypothetical protein [Tissierellales bacterium]
MKNKKMVVIALLYIIINFNSFALLTETDKDEYLNIWTKISDLVPDERIKNLQTAISSSASPKLRAAYAYHLGQAYMERGDYNLGEEQYLHSITLTNDPDIFYPPFERLVNYHMENSDFQGAETLLDSLKSQKQAYLSPYISKKISSLEIEIDIKLEKYLEIDKLIRDAEEKYTDYVDLRKFVLETAMKLGGQGDYEKQYSVYKYFAELHPEELKNEGFFWDYAHSVWSVDREGSIPLFNKFLEQFPNSEKVPAVYNRQFRYYKTINELEALRIAKLIEDLDAGKYPDYYQEYIINEKKRAMTYIEHFTQNFGIDQKVSDIELHFIKPYDDVDFIRANAQSSTHEAEKKEALLSNNISNGNYKAARIFSRKNIIMGILVALAVMLLFGFIIIAKRRINK